MKGLHRLPLNIDIAAFSSRTRKLARRGNIHTDNLWDASTMLKKSFVLLILAQCLARVTSAADYLVRVDSIDYVDSPASESTPKEVGFHSMEIVCRPDLPVRCTAQIENTTLTLDALLRLAKDGVVTVTLDYCHAVDKGDTVPDDKGGRRKQLDKNGCKTNVTVHMNQVVELGGLNYMESDGKTQRNFKNVVRITMHEFHPADSTGR